MSAAENPVIGRIHEAVDTAASVVAAVQDFQWDLPTECDGWTVRALTNHLIGGIAVFAATLRAEAPAQDHESDWIGDDAEAAFAAASADDLEAWHGTAGSDRPVELGIGTLPRPFAAVIHLTELVVHAIDLAVATGNEHLVDEAAATALLTDMREMGGIDAFRAPGLFGPAAPCPESAPPHRQLLAYVGRIG